jgi:dihydrofolate synthase/folylpolyglutamate synthase
MYSRDNPLAFPGGAGERWLESLSPWPEEFGLERIRALLATLGDPQRAFPAIHVVGTNGKTTTTRSLEAILAREGLSVGAYTSPHVTGWSERIRVAGEDADLERALARVREPAEAVGATQFEVLTAAAFAEFALAGVEVAAVEAGLGGRYDATNVLDAPVVVLTNVSLEHTDVLGDTREAIAREKLAVLSAGAAAVLGEPEWSELARGHGAGTVIVEPGGNAALAAAAAGALLGRPVKPVEVSLPGHLELREGEIWDGAHTPEGVRYIAPELPPLTAIVVSVLGDKDADGILAALADHADVLVATRSSHPRALDVGELARRAERHFARVEVEPNPARAVALARSFGTPVLVTGSLYLLADLYAAGPPSAAKAYHGAAR